MEENNYIELKGENLELKEENKQLRKQLELLINKL